MIGRARPLSLFVETFGTGKAVEEKILAVLEDKAIFDFRPQAIINELNLLNLEYAPTAAYGHFGRTDIELPWEKLDKVDTIKQALGV